MANNNNKINFEIKKDKFSDLLDKLTALNKISDIVKMKISKDEVFIYALKGESVILAFKSFLLNTSDYFTIKEEFDFTFDLVIGSVSKFIKTANFFNLTSSEKLVLTMAIKEKDEEEISVRNAIIKDNVFSFAIIIAEAYKIRDINKKMLYEKIKVENKQWEFNTNSTVLENIKKMSAIYETDILNIVVKNSNVIISQGSYWNLVLDKVETDDNNIIFDRSYLKLINLVDSTNINFSIYDRFMLFREDNMILLIAFELSFNN